MNAQFIDLRAAADFLGPGAVEVSRYQTEITDIVRRRGVFGQRIKQLPATGHPSRFFEQTAIASFGQAPLTPMRAARSIANPTPMARGMCEAIVEVWGITARAWLPNTLCRPPEIGSSAAATRPRRTSRSGVDPGSC